MMVCLENFVLWTQVHKTSAEISEIYDNVQHLLKVTPNQNFKLVLCLAEPNFHLNH